jgi:Icc-related predicted phosphoesterase
MEKGKSIKFLTVSDVVTPIDDIKGDDNMSKGIDFILSCGDLPPEYLTTLTTSLKAPLYYVCGNHDIRYRTKNPQGCINMHGRLETVRGIKLLGLEGSIWYNGGPYQYKELKMSSIIRRLRFQLWWSKGVDIVITHAPPRKIHDQPDPCHIGFESFRWLIKKYKPLYLIHGHIHRNFTDHAERITTENQTQVVNSYGFCFLEINSR